MAWSPAPPRKGPHWSHNREYQRNRATLRRRRDDCARCGLPIDYASPYWLTIMGRKRINPRAFIAGHILDRAAGGTHELGNLQAEHAGCSITSGAVTGATRRWASTSRIQRPATASRW